jgi:hypothetical protein
MPGHSQVGIVDDTVNLRESRVVLAVHRELKVARAELCNHGLDQHTGRAIVLDDQMDAIAKGGRRSHDADASRVLKNTCRASQRLFSDAHCVLKTIIPS